MNLYLNFSFVTSEYQEPFAVEIGHTIVKKDKKMQLVDYTNSLNWMNKISVKLIGFWLWKHYMVGF